MSRRHHLPLSADAATRALQVSTVLEDRLAIQRQEIHTLLGDNKKLSATHVELKEALALAQQEVRDLTALADDVKAQRDGEVREVYEKSLRMDAEVRSISAMKAELVQVRTDVQNLTMLRQELNAELQSINDDLAKAREEAKHVPAIKAEIETVRREIQKGRAAIEQEKSTQASNLEHGRMMEKNMLLLDHEIERLRAVLVNAEKQARTVTEAPSPSPGFAASYENSNAGYGRTPNSNPYGIHKGGSDAGPFVSGEMHSNHDMQQPNAHT